MLKRTAATLAVLAGAATSAAYAHTGPGAVVHATTTAAATVGTFVACYAVAALPAEVRAAWRARCARARLGPVIDVVPVLERDVELTPSGTMTTDEIEQHWQAP